MKKILLFSVLCVLAFAGCDNEFDLIDTWKEIPIVYGILDVTDNTHYIRVEKAFLDPETSAFVLAQEPDSLFFDNIQVELRERDEEGQIERTIQLERVNANDEGLIKEEGIFASDPNFLYKTDAILDAEFTYELRLTVNDSPEPIIAETPLIDEITVLTPVAPSLSATFRLWSGLTEARFVWQHEPDAVFFDVDLRINYTESMFGDPGSTVEKSIVWSVARQFSPDIDESNPLNTSSLENISHEIFKNFLVNNLVQDPNICRDLTSVDLILSSGGAELLNFINVGTANNNITGSVPLNEYTNLSEGLGIFSTRQIFEVQGIQISDQVFIDMTTDVNTAGLNFRTISDGPCN
ncbi:MAG: hypothetical protein AAF598_19495 [Bacteroidota bacterium]